jgi:hypothetical protein
VGDRSTDHGAPGLPPIAWPRITRSIAADSLRLSWAFSRSS